MTDAAHTRLDVRHDRDIIEARKVGRDMARDAGFGAIACIQVATAISELARNIVVYAGHGVISIGIVRGETGKVGIEVVAADEGPGIEDTELAMRDGFSSAGGLGLGLPGTQRLMDRFELTSKRDQGTTVRAAKWLAHP
jgi:serine/threonine-protein kinase RsbT